jgi:hypothetical protein
MRTKVRLLPLVVGLLVVVPATPSLADRPQIVEFDDTFLDPFASAACGFPVQVRVQGRLIMRDQGGSATISAAQYFNTFTNLETGRQVVLQFSGQQADLFDADDGRIVSTSIGASRIVIPGMGAVSINAGQLGETIVFDPETFEIISYEITQKGRFDGPIDELLCMLLSM